MEPSKSLPGRAEMQREVSRLLRMREAEDILARYEKLQPPEGRNLEQVRQARVELENALGEYVTASVTGVRSGAAGAHRPVQPLPVSWPRRPQDFAWRQSIPWR